MLLNVYVGVNSDCLLLRDSVAIIGNAGPNAFQKHVHVVSTSPTTTNDGFCSSLFAVVALSVSQLYVISVRAGLQNLIRKHGKVTESMSIHELVRFKGMSSLRWSIFLCWMEINTP